MRQYFSAKIPCTAGCKANVSSDTECKALKVKGDNNYWNKEVIAFRQARVWSHSLYR